MGTYRDCHTKSIGVWAKWGQGSRGWWRVRVPSREWGTKPCPEHPVVAGPLCQHRAGEGSRDHRITEGLGGKGP